MKRILLFIWMTMFPLVCGAEEMTFVTVIGAPWGVVNSVGGMGGTSSVKTLNFVTVQNFTGTGTIQLTQNGEDPAVEAQLGKVFLAQDAELSVSDNEGEGVGAWEVAKGSVAIKPNGTIEVKQLGSNITAATLNFMNDPDTNQRSFLKVTTLKVTTNPPPEEEDEGKLTFADDAEVAALYTKKVVVGDDNTWYEEENGEPQRTLKWEKCTTAGSSVKCGDVVVSEVAAGDYILMGS